MAVFISYASERQAEANQLAKVLEAEGIATFVDHHKLAVGQIWHRKIAEAVENSDALIVLMCRDSDQSPWVVSEVQHAIKIKLPIFPVQLEEVGRLDLGFMLGPRHWFDWTGHDNDDLKPLVAELRQVKSRGPNVRPSRRATPVSSPSPNATATADTTQARASAAEKDRTETYKKTNRENRWVGQPGDLKLVEPTDTLQRDHIATAFAAATEKAKSQTDEQLNRTVVTLRKKYDRQLKDFGTTHPSVLQTRDKYVAAWVNLMHRILDSLPPVPNAVQLTKPRRILLGQIARKAKYERFGIQFRTPKPGSRRERKLAGIDDRTGADIADMLSNLVEPEDRRKIIVALGSGQTAPIETIVRLLPSANLAEVRDC